MKKGILLSLALWLCAIGVTLAQNLPAYVPKDGLVGYWPFEGNVNDVSGNGNHGVLEIGGNGVQPTLTLDRSNNPNSAYSFPGNGAHITLPKTDGNTIVNSFTYSLWIKQEFVNDFLCVIDATYSAKLGMLSPNSSGFRAYDGNSFYEGAISPSIAEDKWKNFTVIYSNQNLLIYVNGILVTNTIFQNKVTYVNGPTKLGLYSGGTYSYKGLMDDIGIWNRALTPEEVEQIFTGEIKKPCLPSYVPTDGLVGYWSFCGDASDQSGNGNDGVVNGATLTKDRFGEFNKAYNFNGIDNFINVDFQNKEAIKSNFTVSAWAKHKDVADFLSVFAMDAKGVFIYPPFQNQIRIYSNDTNIATNDQHIETDAWYHITAVYLQDNFYLYVNGEKVMNVQNNFNAPIYLPVTFLNIGGYPPASQYYFSGDIDDVGIWNRILNPEEVRQLYLGEINNPCLPEYVPTDGLVGYWPFCGDGSDESGNGNDGVVNGAILTTDRFGNTGSAYNFDGLPDTKIIVSLKNEIQGTKSYSVWLKYPENFVNYYSHILTGNNTSGDYLSINGKEPTYISNGTIGKYYDGKTGLTSTIPFNDNNWHHLVVVHDYTNNKALLYIDGILDKEMVSNNFSVNQSFDQFAIGSTFSRSFQVTVFGDLDDIGIWNRALTPEEIEQLYTGEIKKPCLPEYVPTDGLVGYWPFCGDARDESGNGNDGVVAGPVLTIDRFETNNSAYAFDNNQIRVEIPNSQFVTDFTISNWIYLDSAVANRTYPTFMVTDSFGLVFQFELWPDRTKPKANFYFLRFPGQAGIQVEDGHVNSQVRFNEWMHLSVVNQNGINHLYINGKLVATSQGKSQLQGKGGGKFLTFGNANPRFDEQFKGKMDDIGIWNRALTPEEIEQLFDGEIKKPCLPDYVPTDGLVGYWPFCGDASDESGNGNDGVVNGATLTSDRFGQENGAYSFDGKTSHISCINNNLPTSNSSRTFSAWYYLTPTPGYDDAYAILSYGINSFPNGRLNDLFIKEKLVEFNTHLYWAEYEHPSNFSTQWHHVAIMYDSTSIDNIYVYLDGVKVNAQLKNIGGVSELNTLSTEMLIGKVINQYNSNFYFNGKLDDIGVWNRALSGEEIKKLYVGDNNYSCSLDSILNPTLFYGKVTDIDNNSYPTIKIGSQRWMAENLKTTRFQNGDEISNIQSLDLWISNEQPYWTYYNNDSSLDCPIGKLYNWKVASDTRNVCPTGWHVPSIEEFEILTTYLGGNLVAGAKLKSDSKTYWGNPSRPSGNLTGFSALPGGALFVIGFAQFNAVGAWWSSTQSYDNHAFFKYLQNDAFITNPDQHVLVGHSIRCVEDNNQSVNIANISTVIPTQITTNNAISGGQITSDGGSPVTMRGVVWSTSPNPTLLQNNVTNDGKGSGSYSSILTGLKQNTIYYVRAYAVTEAGIAYGDEKSFVTSVPSLTLSLDTLTLNKGESGLIRVRARNFTDLLSAQFTLRFDPTIVAFEGVEALGLDSLTQESFNLSQTADGVIMMAWTQNDGVPVTLADDSTLFALSFKALGSNNQVSQLTFVNEPVAIEFVSRDLGLVSGYILNPGAVTIFSQASLTGQLRTELGDPIRNATINTSATPAIATQSQNDGAYSLTLPENVSYTITPTKGNDTLVTNGITIADVLRIHRHILNVSPLPTPYKIIAADVNQSGSVSSVDMNLLNALILGRISTLPSGKLWSFVPSDYVFPNPAKPFPFPDFRTLPAFGGAVNQDFIGVKLGDVNNSYDPSQARSPQSVVTIYTENAEVQSGASITVAVKVKQFSDISGFQCGIRWNPAILSYTGMEAASQLAGAEAGEDLIAQGQLNLLWTHPEALSVSVADGEAIVYLHFQVIGAGGSSSPVAVFDSHTAPVQVINYDLEVVPVNTLEGVVTVATPSATDETMQNGFVSTASPNPFMDAVQMTVSSSQELNAVLVIYNLSGQMVSRKAVQIPAGTSRLEEGSTLTPGAYIMRWMSAGGKTLSTVRVIKQ